jgi:8-oxo-dGTP diphosphatase
MDTIDFEKISKEALKSGIQRFVVGSVIIDSNKFLLLQRPKNDFMGGIYELPSGKVEDRESLPAALTRETKEETGLDIKEISKYLGLFDYVSGSGKKTRQFNFLVTVKDSSKVVLTEHDSFVWSAKNELANFSITDSVKNILSFLSS